MNSDPYDPNNYWTQEAMRQADTARSEERKALTELASQQFNNRSNVELIVLLRDQLTQAQAKMDDLRQVNVRLAGEKLALDTLLSAPMHEIAAAHQGFAETYDAQQLSLAKWILSQMSYAETAFALGQAGGMRREQVLLHYRDSVTSVLANATKHGNNAVTNAVLKKNANKIIQRAA